MKKKKPEAWGMPVSFRLDEETLALLDKLNQFLGGVGRSGAIKLAIRLAIAQLEVIKK